MTERPASSKRWTDLDTAAKKAGQDNCYFFGCFGNSSYFWSATYRKQWVNSTNASKTIWQTEDVRGTDL
ncbi:unnamed protein product [Menidia menidia]|uniref:(Atlantic silverside) hypothetical protein n=1 Tax=Menidia menidia TaxID=238744 RepID=A0A8S4BVR1_9TELE|nr:unnamed protein product [Menidia menidia]